MKIITIFFTFFILNISIFASVNLAKNNSITKDKEFSKQGTVRMLAAKQVLQEIINFVVIS